MATSTEGPGMLFEHKFGLEVSPDRMRVLYSGPTPKDEGDPLLAEVAGELAALGVKVPPAAEVLAGRLVAAAAGEQQLTNVVLVEGTSPTPAQDAYLDWDGDFFAKGFLLNEKTGTIDFRQRAAETSVAEGRLLARLVPPQEGKAGVDVFGQSVPVVRPRALRVRTGPNVRWEESESCYYATASGRIRWAANLLAVDPVVEITGSVDLSTGNINHPGALVVNRDIESGSVVKAAGNVEVKGAIEAAEVESGGVLVVFGGITGGDGRRIVAAGEIHARFVRDTDLEAGGDIVVEKEIVQSVAKTRGMATVPRGRIVGGEVTALRGIEVQDVGSQGGIPTELTVGEDFARAVEIAQLQDELGTLEKTVARMNLALDQAATRASKLSAEQIQAVMTLEQKVQLAEKEMAELRARIKGSDAPDMNRIRIIVHGCLYPESVLRFGNERLRITDAVKGPLTVLLTGRGVVMMPGVLASKA